MPDGVIPSLVELHGIPAKGIIGHTVQRFDQDGRLTDEPTRQRIQNFLSALLKHVKTNRIA